MAEKIYPVASNNMTYYCSDLQNLNKSYIKNKTLIGDSSLKVTAKSTPNMSVYISTGSAFNNGMFYQNDSAKSVTISSNSASYPRKDAICVYFNGASSSIVVIQGSPSSSPTISSTATDSNHILLAEILVGVGATSIQSSNITDRRSTTSQYTLESLDSSIHSLEDKVISLDNGKPILYSNTSQTDNFIMMSRLVEFRDINYKIQNIYFYLSSNYVSSSKVYGKDYSIVTLPLYFAMGNTYSININLSASQNALLSSKFDGPITFTSPTSSGFNVFIPNKTDDVYDCTLFVTISGN